MGLLAGVCRLVTAASLRSLNSRYEPTVPSLYFELKFEGCSQMSRVPQV